MTDKHTLQAYLTKIEAELRDNILPFWIKHTKDAERGGFYGEISNKLVVNRDATKGALLASRILWTYAAAYHQHPMPEYLDMAHYAYDTLVRFFWDNEHEGLYWEIAADGAPINTRKAIYGQAFGIYALSEYYAVTDDQDALDKSIAIFRRIEQHSYDSKYRGYLESCSRDWQPDEDLRLSTKDMNEAKSQNTHLHVMEAYTNLLRVWDNEELRRKQIELVDVMLAHVIHPTSYHAQLFFDEKWASKSDHISYGHDIEASWLLVEAAEVLGDSELLRQVKALALKMAQTAYDEGLDDDGAILYEANPHGFTNTDKEWWPQAEAAVGFLNAYQLSGKPHFLEATLRCWDFIEAHLIDRQYGEWFRYVTRGHKLGAHDAAKVSFWKCPYHNGRACLELIRRLNTLS
ncbi:MAG: AGE family epimerase/isomerase [Anaerolineae bacterium]|nr:AGE family epimerase/isomerase [Anaerolineae bacterium]